MTDRLMINESKSVWMDCFETHPHWTRAPAHLGPDCFLSKHQHKYVYRTLLHISLYFILLLQSTDSHWWWRPGETMLCLSSLRQFSCNQSRSSVWHSDRWWDALRPRYDLLQGRTVVKEAVGSHTTLTHCQQIVHFDLNGAASGWH